MEIKINGKTYDSGLIKFGVALEAIKLEKKITERQKIIVNGTDEEVLAELESINEIKEFYDNANFLIKFFNNQFTLEEFEEGYVCESLQDFNELIIQAIGECKFGIVKGFGEPEKKK